MAERLSVAAALDTHECQDHPGKIAVEMGSDAERGRKELTRLRRVPGKPQPIDSGSGEAREVERVVVRKGSESSPISTQRPGVVRPPFALRADDGEPLPPPIAPRLNDGDLGLARPVADLVDADRGRVPACGCGEK